MIAARPTGIVVGTDEARLGDTDRREVESDPQMAGEPAAPGMGDTLTVTDDQVRSLLQLAEGFDNRRSFAKGQKTRHIGKAAMDDGDRRLLHGESIRIKHDNRGTRGPTASRVGDIDPRNPLR